MAGTSFFQILIKIAKQGDGADQAVSSLYRLKSLVSSAAAIFGTLAVAGYAVDRVITKNVGAFSDLADQVQLFSNATGLSASESSKLLQITDDLFISNEKLIKAIKTGADSYDYSIDGIAAMSAEYNTLGDAQAKAEYARERFGKGWIEFVPLLKLGGDAIRDLADAQRGALVLDERALALNKQLKQTEDELADSKLAMSVAAGQFLTPEMIKLNTAIADSINGWNELFVYWRDTAAIKQMAQEMANAANTMGPFTEAQELHAQGTRAWGAFQATANDYMEQATRLYFEQKDALEDLTPATEDQSEAVAGLTAEMDILKAALSGDLQQALDNYDVKMGDLTSEHEELTASLQQLVAWGYGPTSEKIGEVNEKLAANEKAQKDLAKATELATNKMIYQQVASKLSAKGALELGRSLGMISEMDYNMAVAMETLTEQFADQDGNIPDEKIDDYIKALAALKTKVLNLPEGWTIDILVNYITTGTPPPYVPPTNNPPCFAAGTLIATPTGDRPIEHIQPGDEVNSLADGKEIATRVELVFLHTAEEVKNYYVINGFLRVTGEHPIHVNNGWMAARNICTGDLMTMRGGERQEVTSIELKEESIPVFNLEIGHECHNYYADNVLAHNKEIEDEGGYAGGGVAYGPTAGHWELLHGTEAVIPLRGGAVPVTIQGGGGESVSFAGATFNVNLSAAANMGDFMQAVMNAAGQ